MCGVEDESNFLHKSVCNCSTVFSRLFRLPRWPQHDASLISYHFYDTWTKLPVERWDKLFDYCAHLSIKVLDGRVVFLHEVAGHELDSERRLADAPRPEHHHLELLHRGEAPGLWVVNPCLPPFSHHLNVSLPLSLTRGGFRSTEKVTIYMGAFFLTLTVPCPITTLLLG